MLEHGIRADRELVLLVPVVLIALGVLPVPVADTVPVTYAALPV